MSNENKIFKKEYLADIFKKYDSDGSGAIELRELVEMLQKDEEIPRRIVKKVFKYSDQNNDNKINLDEFIDMVHDKKLKDLFGHYVNTYVNFILPRQKRSYKPVGRRALSTVEAGETRESQVDGAYDSTYSCYPPPIGLFLITVMEIVCFIIDEQRDSNSAKVGSGLIAQVLIYNPHKRKEYWRYLTYMFVHIGYTHIIVNLIVQLALGIPLEMVHKCWRILIVYFLGVITGSLFTSIMDPYCYLAGASGGVYALITAHIASIIMNFKDMSYGIVHLIVILILICFDVASALYNRYTMQLDESIGYAAHFGGALAGLLVGIWVLRNVDVTTKEKYIWWIALVLYIILMIILIVLNIFWTSHFLH